MDCNIEPGAQLLVVEYRTFNFCIEEIKVKDKNEEVNRYYHK